VCVSACVGVRCVSHGLQAHLKVTFQPTTLPVLMLSSAPPALVFVDTVLAPHPVRYAVDPWVAAVTQGYTASIEGVYSQ
jgi:hypothetical protein